MSTTIPLAARVRTPRPVWLVCVVVSLLAAVATELYGLVARAVGVPMSAAGVGSAKAGPIQVGMFAMGTATCMFWGTILAMLLARFARRPARTWLVVTPVLTALSLLAPGTAQDTAVSTKVMLCLAHLLAASIIIPVVYQRLRQLPDRS
jgi:hypothetical protein